MSIVVVWVVLTLEAASVAEKFKVTVLTPNGGEVLLYWIVRNTCW